MAQFSKLVKCCACLDDWPNNSIPASQMIGTFSFWLDLTMSRNPKNLPGCVRGLLFTTKVEKGQSPSLLPSTLSFAQTEFKFKFKFKLKLKLKDSWATGFLSLLNIITLFQLLQISHQISHTARSLTTE